MSWEKAHQSDSDTTYLCVLLLLWVKINLDSKPKATLKGSWHETHKGCGAHIVWTVLTFQISWQGSNPTLSKFGIHHRLESCALTINALGWLGRLSFMYLYWVMSSIRAKSDYYWWNKNNWSNPWDSWVPKPHTSTGEKLGIFKKVKMSKRTS